MTELHSVDVLTDGQWVPVRGVLRWQGEHMAPPSWMPIRNVPPDLCICGNPLENTRRHYCEPCRVAARRRTSRSHMRRKRAEKRSEAA